MEARRLPKRKPSDKKFSTEFRRACDLANCQHLDQMSGVRRELDNLRANKQKSATKKLRRNNRWENSPFQFGRSRKWKWWDDFCVRGCHETMRAVHRQNSGGSSENFSSCDIIWVWSGETILKIENEEAIRRIENGKAFWPETRFTPNFSNYRVTQKLRRSFYFQRLVKKMVPFRMTSTDLYSFLYRTQLKRQKEKTIDRFASKSEFKSFP